MWDDLSRAKDGRRPKKGGVRSAAHGTACPEPWLQWIERRARVYEPEPLGRLRSRDPEDYPFLACALACGARLLVSKDKDLLALEKPFGIQILHPRQFLAPFNQRAIRRSPQTALTYRLACFTFQRPSG